METRNEARNRQRLTKKIKGWLQSYKPIFLSLTFSNKILETTTEQEREALVINYLKSETALFMANKDYGEKNGREHYHAIAIATTLKNSDIEDKDLRELKNRINLEPWQKYGLIDSRFIAYKYRFKNDYDFTKTAEHTARHFRKPSTKGSRLIVNRKEPTKEEQLKRLQLLRLYLLDKENERLKKWKEDYKKRNPTATDEEAEIMADALSDYDDFIESAQYEKGALKIKKK